MLGLQLGCLVFRQSSCSAASRRPSCGSIGGAKLASVQTSSERFKLSNPRLDGRCNEEALVHDIQSKPSDASVVGFPSTLRELSTTAIIWVSIIAVEMLAWNRFPTAAPSTRDD